MQTDPRKRLPPHAYFGHLIQSSCTELPEPLPPGHDGWDHVLTTLDGQELGRFTNMGEALAEARKRFNEQQAAAGGLASAAAGEPSTSPPDTGDAPAATPAAVDEGAVNETTARGFDDAKPQADGEAQTHPESTKSQDETLAV